MITTFTSIERPLGTREVVDYESLTKRIESTPTSASPWGSHKPSTPEVNSHKWHQRGWSPATFVQDTRSKTSVERVSMLVYDVDSKLERYTPERTFEILSEYSCFVHTTASYTVEMPRFRLILPLSRDVTAHEYARLWSKVTVKLTVNGVRPDSAVREAGKFWFWYTPVEGREHFTRCQRGKVIDPDQLMNAKGRY